jgi:hypothetical protein
MKKIDHAFHVRRKIPVHIFRVIHPLDLFVVEIKRNYVLKVSRDRYVLCGHDKGTMPFAGIIQEGGISCPRFEDRRGVVLYAPYMNAVSNGIHSTAIAIVYG